MLMLTGSFFMLQVYDRVLPSRSVPTLVALGALAVALYAFQGFLDLFRGRIIVRIASFLDEKLSGSIYDAVATLPLKVQGRGADGLQPVRDLDQIRGFMSGLGPTALFDLPWMPLYLGICFVFHYWIGLTALAGAIVLVRLAVLAGVLARAPAKGRRRGERPQPELRRSHASQCRGAPGHGHARPACRGVEKYQREILGILTARRRRRRGHWIGVSRVAHAAPIDGPRGRRLSGD